MNTPLSNLPDYLMSTYTMLKCAFSDGLIEDGYVEILSILREEGRLSFRNVAFVAATFTNKEYTVVLNDTYKAASGHTLDYQIRERILRKLQGCGYEIWISEER